MPAHLPPVPPGAPCYTTNSLRRAQTEAPVRLLGSSAGVQLARPTRLRLYYRSHRGLDRIEAAVELVALLLYLVDQLHYLGCVLLCVLLIFH